MKPVIAADVDDLVRRFVRRGDHLHLTASQSRPNALTYALCRVFGDTGRFTVSTTAVHTSAHALTLSGSVDKVIAGFVGDTYPSPRPNPLYAKLSEGMPFTFEAWSLLSYVQRLTAALSRSRRSWLRATLEAGGLSSSCWLRRSPGLSEAGCSGCRPIRRRWSVSLYEAMVNR